MPKKSYSRERSSQLPQFTRAHRASGQHARRRSTSRLAVAHLRVVDADVLRGAGERVALIDRDLAVRIAPVRMRLLDYFRLLRSRVLGDSVATRSTLASALALTSAAFAFLTHTSWRWPSKKRPSPCRACTAHRRLSLSVRKANGTQAIANGLFAGARLRSCPLRGESCPLASAKGGRRFDGQLRRCAAGRNLSKAQAEECPTAQTLSLLIRSLILGSFAGAHRSPASRRWVLDMPRHNPMYDEQLDTLASPPNAVPSWEREAMVPKVQSVDGCLPREVRRQIDERAQSLCVLVRPPPSRRPRHVAAQLNAPVYVRRTDCSRLP